MANLVEAMDVSERVFGLPIVRAITILDPLFEGTLVAIPSTSRGRRTLPRSESGTSTDVLAVAADEGLATLALLAQG